MRERTLTTKPAGEGCRARGRRSRLQMMPKWCPGSDPCRLGGGMTPGGTAGAAGADRRERRDRSQPFVTFMSELLRGKTHPLPTCSGRAPSMRRKHLMLNRSCSSVFVPKTRRFGPSLRIGDKQMAAARDSASTPQGSVHAEADRSGWEGDRCCWPWHAHLACPRCMCWHLAWCELLPAPQPINGRSC